MLLLALHNIITQSSKNMLFISSNEVPTQEPVNPYSVQVYKSPPFDTEESLLES